MTARNLGLGNERGVYPSNIVLVFREKVAFRRDSRLRYKKRVSVRILREAGAVRKDEDIVGVTWIGARRVFSPSILKISPSHAEIFGCYLGDATRSTFRYWQARKNAENVYLLVRALENIGICVDTKSDEDGVWCIVPRRLANICRMAFGRFGERLLEYGEEYHVRFIASLLRDEGYIDLCSEHVRVKQKSRRLLSVAKCIMEFIGLKSSRLYKGRSGLWTVAMSKGSAIRFWRYCQKWGVELGSKKDDFEKLTRTGLRRNAWTRILPDAIRPGETVSLKEIYRRAYSNAEVNIKCLKASTRNAVYRLVKRGILERISTGSYKKG